MTATTQRAGPAWATSCHGDPSAVSPLQTAALTEHLALCTRAGEGWPAAAVAIDALRGFVGSRLVTTAAVGGALLGTTWLIWS